MQMQIGKGTCGAAAPGLFVASLHRSGSSRLRRILDSHPKIWLGNEFGAYMFLNIPFGEHSRHILRRWKDRRNNPFDKDWIEGRKPRRLHLADNLLFVSRYLAGLRRFTREVVTAAAVTSALQRLVPDCRYVGDKYPDYWWVLDRMAREQDLKAVALIRDPRDVTSSSLVKARGVWKKSWPPEMRNAEAVAKRWVQMVEAVERNREHLHIVYYEQYVMAPQIVFKRLARWLALDAASFDYSSLYQKSIGKYRTGLSAAELDQVLRVAGDHMRAHGYDLDRPGLQQVAL